MVDQGRTKYFVSFLSYYPEPCRCREGQSLPYERYYDRLPTSRFMFCSSSFTLGQAIRYSGCTFTPVLVVIEFLIRTNTRSPTSFVGLIGDYPRPHYLNFSS